MERKARPKVDLSKATVLGESKVHKGGELVEMEDAYYVRKPDQDNRQVFKLTKKSLRTRNHAGRSERAPRGRQIAVDRGFVSKRGNKFAAYLVLSPKKDKAEFEFPPR